MTTSEQLLSVARGQIGTVEGPGGSTRYGQFYGLDKVAWCAQFVYWCFHQTDYSRDLIPKTAYTPTLAGWYRSRAWWTTQPSVGALVFYDFPDSVARIQHVGIVESVPAAGQIITIEGNTSSGDAGSQANGDGVWRRRRTTASVVGYGLPSYTRPAADPWLALPTLQQGSKGAAVSALQRFCNAHAWRPALPLLKVDGDYGPATTAVVKAAQRQLGITGADAVGTPFGPRTKQAFWNVGFRG